MASTTALDNALRDKHLQELEAFFIERGYTVLRVPLSDNSSSTGYQLAIDELDSESNEKTTICRVSVCKVKRSGEAYDPYEENQRYLENVAAAENKKKVRKEKERLEEAKKKNKKKIGNKENPVE